MINIKERDKMHVELKQMLTCLDIINSLSASISTLQGTLNYARYMVS